MEDIYTITTRNLWNGNTTEEKVTKEKFMSFAMEKSHRNYGDMEYEFRVNGQLHNWDSLPAIISQDEEGSRYHIWYTNGKKYKACLFGRFENHVFDY